MYLVSMYLFIYLSIYLCIDDLSTHLLANMYGTGVSNCAGVMLCSIR